MWCFGTVSIPVDVSRAPNFPQHLCLPTGVMVQRYLPTAQIQAETTQGLMLPHPLGS